MKYEFLKNKEFTHINFPKIKNKYINYTGDIKFTENEIKSILSIILGYKLHISYFENKNYDDINNFFNEKNYYFNISIAFGRLLIENLEEFNIEWLKEIKNQSFILKNIIENTNLSEFVDEVLLDQMNIRQWEYGKHFLEQFSKNFENDIKWCRNKNQIINALTNKNDFWDTIYKKFNVIKEPIENYEALLIAYFFKNKIQNLKLDLIDYSLLAAISMQKMQYIYKRELLIKQSFHEVISINWKQNKGKGGPKL